MKTKTTIINISIDTKAVDDRFDFFSFKTSKKFIAKGARFLDIGEDTKAESIAFDYGVTAFAMFKKNSMKLAELQNKLADADIAARKVSVDELKEHIVVRLLLNSLGNSNYDGFEFNNLTGRLYFFLPDWVAKNGKSVKALDISTTSLPDGRIRLNANACTFTRVSCFKTKPDSRFARYSISINGTMKRVFENDPSYNSEGLFVRKTPSGKKTEIPFIDFSKGRQGSTRVAAIYKVINSFNAKFAGLCSLSFDELEIKEKLDSKRDEDFLERSVSSLSRLGVNVVNLDVNEEDRPDFDRLIENISRFMPGCRITESDSVSNSIPNVVFMHNADYYKENGYDDLYKTLPRNAAVQCVTEEDAGSSSSEAVIKTIIKELAIKQDIIHGRKITLDDWPDYGFANPVSFGMIEDEVPYFIEISPNGEISTIKSRGIFHTFTEEKYDSMKQDLLSSINSGGVYLISDGQNEIIISSTGVNTLPDEDIFVSESPRGKEARAKFMAGVTDINLYESGESTVYNVGVIGKGMNSSLPKGSVLYKASVVKGHNIIESLLKTMSVMFVKYNSFTVLPYPIKYLREWVAIETSSQD
ncbi:MAG: hypothetical protein MJ228_04155 [Bacilli bacterium]|nr:hypothetical protein [Bacilli bacterium]